MLQEPVIFSKLLRWVVKNFIYAYLEHRLEIGTSKSKMQSDVTEVADRTYVKGSRIHHPKVCHLAYWLFSDIGTGKNSKRREKLSLNSPYLPKGRSSKKKSIVLDPLPGSFISQGRLPLATGKEKKLIPQPERLYDTLYLPSILLKPHLSFLTIIYSLLKCLYPLFPFPVESEQNSVGLLGTEAFLLPVSCCGKQTPASMNFPESQRADSNSC